MPDDLPTPRTTLRTGYWFVTMFALAGCATESTGPSGGVVGYRYYDANHPNTVVGASPQAIYNATHGTWLWPPATWSGP